MSLKTLIEVFLECHMWPCVPLSSVGHRGFVGIERWQPSGSLSAAHRKSPPPTAGLDTDRGEHSFSGSADTPPEASLCPSVHWTLLSVFLSGFSQRFSLLPASSPGC